MPLRLSQEQLEEIAATFEREGYVLVRGVLDASEMAPILKQWDRVREMLRTGLSIDGMRRENFFIHGKLPAPVGDVVVHPTVNSIAKRLLGPDVAVYLNRLNVKDTAFTAPVHLHQDLPYFNGGPNKINFFLALQDTNINNGAMVFVPRSHKLGAVPRDTIDISKHPELDVVVPSMRPGDLLIADIRLWHSSVYNTQGTDRVLLQMLLQPADDGSYYPLSIPEPRLASGKWRTSEFTPWESMYDTASNAVMEAPLETDAAPQLMAAMDVAPIGAVAAPASPPAPLSLRDQLVVKYWAPLPAGKKRRIKQAVALARLAKTDFMSFVRWTGSKLLPVWAKRLILRALVLIKGGAAREQVGLANWQQAQPVAGEAAAQRKLPKIFTSSSGPEQVWPLAEEYVDWPTELEPTARYLKKAGKTNVLLACRKPVAREVLTAAASYGLNVKGYVHVQNPGEKPFSQKDSLPVHMPEGIRELSGVDAIVVLCSMEFGLAMRRCEQFLRPDILFVPATREAVAPEPVRVASSADWTERSSILTYLYVAGLRGHFAEFGTFFGRAFFPSFYELQHWLQGKFYAFDSFEGLSQPDPRETAYTNGDFVKGAYGFNHASFKALGEILGLPAERIVTVPGFFDKTLSPQKAAELGIAPKSISVCRIDCDLMDPALSVLEFITPLLDDGALVYFDDWRLCRADPNVGERGAALRWLKANPSFELVEFPSVHWQHQWFIFHRNRER